MSIEAGAMVAVVVFEDYWRYAFLASFIYTIINDVLLHYVYRRLKTPAADEEEDGIPRLLKKPRAETGTGRQQDGADVDASTSTPTEAEEGSSDDVQRYAIKSSAELSRARKASEVFLTIDLQNGDVVSFPALLAAEARDPGEVDVAINEYRPVIQLEDGEYGGCLCLLEALEMADLVHLVYVLPDETMMAIRVKF